MRAWIDRTVAEAHERSGCDLRPGFETVLGRGAFVSDRESPFDEGFRHTVLIEAVDGLIVKAHHLRLPDEELLDLVRQRLDAFAERRQRNRKQPESEADHAAE